MWHLTISLLSGEHTYSLKYPREEDGEDVVDSSAQLDGEPAHVVKELAIVELSFELVHGVPPSRTPASTEIELACSRDGTRSTYYQICVFMSRPGLVASVVHRHELR